MKEKLPCKNERRYAVALTCMKKEAKREHEERGEEGNVALRAERRR